jgi:hypothetical protein
MEVPPIKWPWYGLAVLMLSVAAVILATPFSAPLLRSRLQAFHVAKPSWQSWAPWQFIPSMYNYSNFVSSGPEPKLVEWKNENHRVNHYPLQKLTFLPGFHAMYFGGKPFLVLNSIYQTTRLQTVYEMVPLTDQNDLRIHLYRVRQVTSEFLPTEVP